MCFSATVSFGAGAVLLPAGALCVATALERNRYYLPLAVVPAFFGVQQIAEGFVWRAMEAPGEGWKAPAYVFLFFAYFLWPAWIPLAALWAEGPARTWRRAALLGLTAVGLALGLLLYAPLFSEAGRVWAVVHGHSIRYYTWLEGHVLDPTPLRLVYAAVVVSALGLSSQTRLRIFGVLVLASVLVAGLLFVEVFVSVWCFFAAALSAVLLVAIRSLPRLA